MKTDNEKKLEKKIRELQKSLNMKKLTYLNSLENQKKDIYEKLTNEVDNIQENLKQIKIHEKSIFDIETRIIQTKKELGL